MALKSAQSQGVLRCSWQVAEALLSWEGDGNDLRAELHSRGIADADPIIEAAHKTGILIPPRKLEEAEKFFADWTWGPVAATFVFGYHADSFADLDDELQVAEEQRSSADSSLLPERNGAVTPLPPAPNDGLVGIVERRRSRRVFSPQPIEVAPIAACLQSAFGITGEWILDERRLPLTAAPSPGGINTYDAFLLAQNVADLKSGTYCYLPQEHALANRAGDPVPFDRLFGGQDWAAGAACAIVLIADLRRQASRYTYPTTISAALIEAGARVELLLLQAEEASLGAVVVGLNGVGAFDLGLAAAAGLPNTNSMVLPICAVLIGGPADKLGGDS